MLINPIICCAQTLSYTYDSVGNALTQTNENGTIDLEYNSDGTLKKKIMPDNKSVSYTYNTAKQLTSMTDYFGKDLHGDVRYAFNSSCTKIADYTYDAWGNDATSSTSTWAKDNPIRYNGQYLDSETGMYYLRARYYDPNMSRFISEDPIKDGINWYAYAGNNPVMFIDPSGLALSGVIENGELVDYKLPLEDVVAWLGGTVKYNDNSVTVDVLGKNIDISYDSNEGEMIEGKLHFTFGEVLDILGVDYDVTEKNITQTKNDENGDTAKYVAQNVLGGLAIDTIVSLMDIGFMTLFSSGADAYNASKGQAAPVLPAGKYVQRRYSIANPITGSKTAIIDLTYGKDNNYFAISIENWSVEYNSTKVGGGYIVPLKSTLYTS